MVSAIVERLGKRMLDFASRHNAVASMTVTPGRVVLEVRLDAGSRRGRNGGNGGAREESFNEGEPAQVT